MGNDPQKFADSKIDDLARVTPFKREEILQLRDQFLKDFPHGYMNQTQFRSVYQKYYKKGDSTAFADQVFRVFDVNQDGKVAFREFLCSLGMTTRGSPVEKLQWAFNIYDVNGDGTITIKEVQLLVRSIQTLANLRDDRNMTDEKIQAMFDKVDKDHDGRLTLDEFIRGSQQSPQFMKLLIDYAK